MNQLINQNQNNIQQYKSYILLDNNRAKLLTWYVLEDILKSTATNTLQFQQETVASIQYLEN